ncbi:hypothetical protein L1987_21313 [Smallanthus sonchifolius]|uniref:Uncharacterized protein n=1 Tax=Smallanthus sonchifolius TaxID=185202 RepID=A0ACB9IX52_9ASTR|nr:hypothetical protein L1987_21313 [Smallanthus sonchifolius]
MWWMSQGVRDAINFDPKFEEYRHKYHNELREGCFKVRFSEKFLKCPFCPDSRDYDYNDLVHANQIVRESKSASFNEKAKHMGLIDYLERDFHAIIKCFDSTSVNSTPKQNVDEELIVWPWMAVVANIPVEYKNDCGKKLKDDWVKEGYNPVEVHHLLNSQDNSGLAVVEFGKTWDGFFHVMRFTKAFEVSKHGRKGWFDEETCKDDKFYAWIATDEDYNCYGLVGDYLRKNGDLKTVADVQKGRRVSNYGAESYDVQLKIAMEQKEVLIENFNKGIIFNIIELAILEQKKADERVLKLAEYQKREKEKLHHKIIELQKKLDEKQGLELTIKQMKGALEVMKHMSDEQRLEAKKKMKSIQNDLKEKEEELEDLEWLNLK